MFCKFCGEKIEDNATFCSRCGAKLTTEEETDTTIINSVDMENTNLNKNEKTIKKVSDKIPNVIQKILMSCLILGIIGIAIFFSTVLFDLIAYGHVRLFHEYFFIKVLSIISIVLMLIGVCGIITKCILCFIFKIGVFPTTVLKRILLILLTIACLGCSIWGVVDCSNNDWSFYTIYDECYCSYPWADVGADYLNVDTNPYDFDSDLSDSTKYAREALNAIRSINSKLGLPSYLYDEMLETRALDGKQSYSGTKVDVSWRYHPDSGLEVRYTKK